MSDSRYPYTYADDLVRAWAGYGEGGTKISRCDASQIIEGVALVIGLSHEELAIKLADFYKKNEEEITERSVKALMQAIGY